MNVKSRLNRIVVSGTNVTEKGTCVVHVRLCTQSQVTMIIPSDSGNMLDYK